MREHFNNITLERKYLERFLAEPRLRMIIGDFVEEYNDMRTESGLFSARLWFWVQLLKATPSLFSLTTFRSIMMLKNYLKITFRNFRRHKGYSLINILGLATGMASCMLILLWVFDELSYDQFHENADTLYTLYDKKVMNNGTENYSITHPFPVREALMESYPEIDKVTRSYMSYVQISHDKKSFSANGLIVDPSYLEIFTFPLISGDKTKVLNEPNAIVLTEETAGKLFGEKNPVGETVTIQGLSDMIVTGVIQDIQENSTITFDFLVSTVMGDDLPVATNWGTSTWNIYLTLVENITEEDAEKKIRNLYVERDQGGSSLLYLQPFTKTHLYSLGGGGPILYIYIFSAVAAVVLLIASINFMNLTTARSINRAKEVGMRKVSGARTGDLFRQFMGESTVFSLTAFIISVGLVILMLPLFNEYTAKDLDLSALLTMKTTFSFICVSLFTGLVSGLYPALFLSSFKPARVLKSAISPKSTGDLLRKSLVIVQFSLSILLIISSIIIYNQLDFMRNKDLGLEKKNIICLYMNGDFEANHDVIKNELLSNPDIVNITRTYYPPTYRNLGTGGADWEGKSPDQKVSLDLAMIDFDYAETMGLKVKEGRFFSKEYSKDELGAVLNEAAVKEMGFDYPIGMNFSWNTRDYKIIGVVEDYHYYTQKDEIRPQVMLVTPQWYQYYLIKVRPEKTSETITFLENKWNELCSDYDFYYYFLEDRLNGLYRGEERISNIFKAFTFLAIFISCLGLFGLASYTAEQKTKEIGIRKALGSSISKIVILLSREFTKYVFIANLFAWPIAWFISRQWLQNYAYRIQPEISFYLVSGTLALLIAIATISYQTIKAARRNPVDSLRYE
ncbi:ABC transporter permease [candidate division KSB1 bacterium]